MKEFKIVMFLFPFLLFVGTGFVISACSDDDKEESNLYIKYRLQNEDGEEKLVFNYGENIIFDLTMYNHGDYMINLPEEPKLLDHRLFQIFTIDSTYVGTAYNYFRRFSFPTMIAPHSKRSYKAYWISHKTDGLEDNNERDPLPTGEYYTIIDLNIGDTIITKSLNFNIVDHE